MIISQYIPHCFLYFAPFWMIISTFINPWQTTINTQVPIFSITLISILKAFTFTKSIEIHGQIKELFISFLVVKSASNFLSLCRFGEHLMLIRFFWWFCPYLQRECFYCFWFYSILYEANKVKFMSKVKIFSSSNWWKNRHMAKYVCLDLTVVWSFDNNKCTDVTFRNQLCG